LADGDQRFGVGCLPMPLEDQQAEGGGAEPGEK
jgi:hypothetical protein